MYGLLAGRNGESCVLMLPDPGALPMLTGRGDLGVSILRRGFLAKFGLIFSEGEVLTGRDCRLEKGWAAMVEGLAPKCEICLVVESGESVGPPLKGRLEADALSLSGGFKIE
jgi:hypothetical protein